MNALSGTIPCTFAWSLVLTSCSKCASRFTQVTALSWGWHALQETGRQPLCALRQNRWVLLQRLELAKPKEFWDSLPLAKLIKIFRFGINQDCETWKNPTFTYIYIYICIYNTYMIIDSMLAGNHKAAHLLYSTKFHRPSLAFLRAPVFHDFTNTQKTDPYWHVPYSKST